MLFYNIASISARITNLNLSYSTSCTRQGSNLQPYDPKSHTKDRRRRELMEAFRAYLAREIKSIES